MCLAPPCGVTCGQAGRVFYTFETSADTAKEAFLVVWRGDADPSILFRASRAGSAAQVLPGQPCVYLSSAHVSCTVSVSPRHPQTILKAIFAVEFPFSSSAALEERSQVLIGIYSTP